MPRLTCALYHRAQDLPDYFWNDMHHDSANANTILFCAQELVRQDDLSPESTTRAFWAILRHDDKPLFIVACTNGPVRPFPIFIYTATSQIHDAQFLEICMKELVTAVESEVNHDRVFSVFAIDPVCRAFANCWSKRTSIQQELEPYYAARMGKCTLQTLVPDQPQPPEDGEIISWDLRRATMGDLPAVGRLCFEFAAHSPPFLLTKEEAQQEATGLIHRGQIWVHTMCNGTSTEVVAIVATARSSGSTTAITKVVTSTDYQNKGCAKRLVWHVCHELFKSKKDHTVVLYAAHDNGAACHVYSKLGFRGLVGGSEYKDGEYAWTEIGFDKSRVTLGHW